MGKPYCFAMRIKLSKSGSASVASASAALKSKAIKRRSDFTQTFNDLMKQLSNRIDLPETILPFRADRHQHLLA